MAYAQTPSYLTEEELRNLMPDFQRQVEYWNQYEEPERRSEAKAFAENWSGAPTVALFLGKWAAIEETMDIYPSTIEGQVCIIGTDYTLSEVDFSLGKVLNQQIYTDGGETIIQQENYIGVVWNKEKETGVYVYHLIAPASVPTRASWSDWRGSSRVLEQFKAAGCIAKASK
ncbi:hypothetical protein H6F78_00480 [Coleofasciculus sp. FACHB-64]|uniref:hypothetical protein n=1 Tax=Cyanophyceae TaxID=3028117 RepID=UPI001686FF00|nr:hypothetical protein [Coleofasciculus sp. FACHB-64]MBD2044120.1 hypothetical protein [Coleofasciculus sp. FACHB-64]